MEDLNLRQKKHFDSIASDYYKYRKIKSHTSFKKMTWDFFFKKYSKIFDNSHKKISILEPMCGFIEGYQILNSKFNNISNYIGFDYSSEVVNFCKKHYSNLNIKEADIYKFKTKKSFNFGILIGGLHHVSNDIDKAIKNISKYYEKNAHFINLEPTHEYSIIKLIRNFIYKRNSFFDEKTESGIELKALNNFFEKNGFKLITNHRIGYLGYIFFYNPDAFKIFSKLPFYLIYIFFYLDYIISITPILKKLSFATISVYIKIK